MYQNFILPEGKQVFRINHIIYINSLCAVSILTSWWEETVPKSKSLEASQGPAFLRISILRPAMLTVFLTFCKVIKDALKSVEVFIFVVSIYCKCFPHDTEALV